MLNPRLEKGKEEEYPLGLWEQGWEMTHRVSTKTDSGMDKAASMERYRRQRNNGGGKEAACVCAQVE